VSSDDELRALIAAEAEHAEATKDDPIPADALARATRPNLARSVTFSLRLNPEELAEVQAVADDRGVPASTLVRGWIVRQLATERNAPTDTAAVVERLEADVRTLRKLVAS
jgi:hypothetical protein